MMMRIVFLTAALVSLAGCLFSDGSSPAQSVTIDCAAVSNDATPCVPSLSGVVIKVPGVTVVDSGSVSRGQSINASLTASNGTGAGWAGYYEMAFDAGCAGENTWVIVPKQPTPFIAPGAAWAAAVGGSCSDMPLGGRTLTATLYEADSITVVDQVRVQFNLTE